MRTIMTFPEKEELSMPDSKVEKCVGSCLTKVLGRARDEGRLVCGVVECANHLMQDPDHVMLCLLPETAPSDISHKIQQKLIEAYCLENHVLVVKVKNPEKLGFLLNKPVATKTEKDNPVTSPSVDSSCLLIEWPPKVQTSKQELRLMELIWSNQVVELPI